MNFEKHPLNKLKIGDRVRLTEKYFLGYVCTHLVDNFTVPGGRNEFSPDDFNELHFLIGHNIKGTLPEGKVIGYGAEEDNSKKKNVAVEFRYRGKKFSAYYNEKSLTKVKRK